MGWPVLHLGSLIMSFSPKCKRRTGKTTHHVKELCAPPRAELASCNPYKSGRRKVTPQDWPLVPTHTLWYHGTTHILYSVQCVPDVRVHTYSLGFRENSKTGRAWLGPYMGYFYIFHGKTVSTNKRGWGNGLVSKALVVRHEDLKSNPHNSQVQ